MRIDQLPKSPGVYLYKDSKGKILYVGKAINLYKRVKSYFSKQTKEIRITNLLHKAKKVDYIATSNEIETLLLEANLIKQHKPKYNILLKDSKRYLYVGISKDKRPRVYLLRQPEIDKNLSFWVGPFPTSQSLREMMRFLRRIFPYRSCANLPKKPCFYYDLKLCPAPCDKQLSEKEYQKNIQKIKSFLRGHLGRVLANLKKEMTRDAHNNLFERANVSKHKIRTIEEYLRQSSKFSQDDLIERQLSWIRKILVDYQRVEPMIIKRIEGYDVSNLGKKITVASMVVFSSGEPEKAEYRQFRIRRSVGGDTGALSEALERRFKHNDWVYPQVIIVDGGRSQLSAIIGVIEKYFKENHFGIIGITKEKETLVIPYFRNGILSYKTIRNSSKATGLPLIQRVRDESHRFAHRYYKNLHRKATFSSLK